MQKRSGLTDLVRLAALARGALFVATLLSGCAGRCSELGERCGGTGDCCAGLTCNGGVCSLAPSADMSIVECSKPDGKYSFVETRTRVLNGNPDSPLCRPTFDDNLTFENGVVPNATATTYSNHNCSILVEQKVTACSTSPCSVVLLRYTVSPSQDGTMLGGTLLLTGGSSTVFCQAEYNF